MTNGEKKPLTNTQSDADIVIWPRLKTVARRLEYGTFMVRFEVHGSKIRQVEISDERRRIACF